MPTVSVNGARYYYEEQGEGAETIVFSHGFLFSLRMFDAQMRALAPRYRCLAFDWRGQGRSEVAAAGYDVDSLTADAIALIETLGAAPCHFVGLSMGGFVGLRLGIHRPDLLRSLVLLNTSADREPRRKLPSYLFLSLVGRTFGLRPVVGQVMPIMFGRAFMRDPDRAGERRFWRDQIAQGDRVGLFRTAASMLLKRQGVADQLHRIQTPTLVIAGAEDVAFAPEQVKRTAAGIPGAEFVCIPRAGHSSTVERPEAVTQAITGFLERVGAPRLGA